MRYLLLILSCSVLGFAAELEPALGYREAEAAHNAEVAALNNAWEARKKAYTTSIVPLFTTVTLPRLSADPKQSEHKARDAANARNRLVQEITTLTDPLPSLLSAVERYPETMPKLPPFDSSKMVKVEQQNIEKPKEKKKITATLGDGTKVE